MLITKDGRVALIALNCELYAVSLIGADSESHGGIRKAIFSSPIVGVASGRNALVAVALADKSLFTNLRYPESFESFSVEESRGNNSPDAKESSFHTQKKLTSIIAAEITGHGDAFVASDRVGEIWGFGANKSPSEQTSVNLGGHPTSVLTSVALSPCGSYLASTDRNEKIRIAGFPQMLKVP